MKRTLFWAAPVIGACSLLSNCRKFDSFVEGAAAAGASTGGTDSRTGAGAAGMLGAGEPGAGAAGMLGAGEPGAGAAGMLSAGEPGAGAAGMLGAGEPGAGSERGDDPADLNGHQLPEPDRNAGASGSSSAGAAGAALAGDGGTASTYPEPAWTPSQLAPGSLMLWLDAGVGVEGPGGAVSTWVDRSSFGHRVLAATLARSPTLTRSAFGKRPGVRFDGRDDKLSIADLPSLRVGTADFALELVIKNETDTCCQQLIFVKAEPTAPYVGVTAAVNWWTTIDDPGEYPATGEYSGMIDFTPDQVNTPFDDGADYRDGTAHILGLVRYHGMLSIAVDGHVLSTVAVAALDAGARSSTLVIGGHPGADTLQFKGTIAEVVFARNTTGSEISSIGDYLEAKYVDALGH